MGKTVKEVLSSLSSKKKNRKEKGRGAKKYGRHKTHCMRYRSEGRREKNKIRKQRKIQKMLTKKKSKLQRA